MDFVPLSYRKVDTEGKCLQAPGTDSIKRIDYADVFNSSFIESKLILLQGGPGIGKSTTLRKICQDFADGKLPPKITVVIRVLLSSFESGSNPTLGDLIHTCIDQSHCDIVEGIESFAQKHLGDGLLFLFDGFDKLAADLRVKSLIANILSGHAYPKSSCIVASRPSAIALIPPHVFQKMKHIELFGFTKERMKQFILQWFNCKERLVEGEQLIEIIIKNSKLSDICRIPLTVLVACTVASDDEQVSERITELMKSLMCVLANRHLKKQGEEPCILRWEDLEEKYTSLKELAELALHSLIRDMYMLSDHDDSLPHRPSKLYHMGILISSSRREKGVLTKSYRFFHLIAKEFLAAYALSLKSEEEQLAFWKERLVKGPIPETDTPWIGSFMDPKWFDLKSPFKDASLGMLFQFYAGLTSLKVSGIQQMLLDQVNPAIGLKLGQTYHSIPEQLCSIVHESQNVAFCVKLFSHYQPYLSLEKNWLLDPQAVQWCCRYLCFEKLYIQMLVSIPSAWVKCIK